MILVFVVELFVQLYQSYCKGKQNQFSYNSVIAKTVLQKTGSAEGKSFTPPDAIYDFKALLNNNLEELKKLSKSAEDKRERETGRSYVHYRAQCHETGD